MFEAAPGVRSPTCIREWLESPYLDRLVSRVAYGHRLTEDLADLIQETRIALWRLGLNARVSAAFVSQIANNKAADLIRSVIRRRARERAASLLAARGHRAGEDIELQHLLNADVDLLSPRLHDFYDLHYRQGFSERDIARRWGLSRSSVQWLNQRCRRALGSPVSGGHGTRSASVERGYG